MTSRYGRSMTSFDALKCRQNKPLPYWNPNLRLYSEGRARVTLYNNSRTTQIQVEVAGKAADGTMLWNK